METSVQGRSASPNYYRVNLHLKNFISSPSYFQKHLLEDELGRVSSYRTLF